MKLWNRKLNNMIASLFFRLQNILFSWTNFWNLNNFWRWFTNSKAMKAKLCIYWLIAHLNRKSTTNARSILKSMSRVKTISKTKKSNQRWRSWYFNWAKSGRPTKLEWTWAMEVWTKQAKIKSLTMRKANGWMSKMKITDKLIQICLF